MSVDQLLLYLSVVRGNFLTFIDDFSRKTWVYFLKEKYKVFGVLKKFKVMVENETSTTIKVVRSDRGGEYIYQPSS